MIIRAILAVLLLFPIFIFAADETEELAALNKPYTVEYYYRVKWGYLDEFMELYKKNL